MSVNKVNGLLFRPADELGQGRQVKGKVHGKGMGGNIMVSGEGRKRTWGKADKMGFKAGPSHAFEQGQHMSLGTADFPAADNM